MEASSFMVILVVVVSLNRAVSFQSGPEEPTRATNLSQKSLLPSIVPSTDEKPMEISKSAATAEETTYFDLASTKHSAVTSQQSYITSAVAVVETGSTAHARKSETTMGTTSSSRGSSSVIPATASIRQSALPPQKSFVTTSPLMVAAEPVRPTKNVLVSGRQTTKMSSSHDTRGEANSELSAVPPQKSFLATTVPLNPSDPQKTSMNYNISGRHTTNEDKGHSMHFTISPSMITLNQSEEVHIDCAVDTGDPGVRVTELYIEKDKATLTGMDVNAGSVFHQNKNSKNLVKFGSLLDGFLWVTLTKPTCSDWGWYRCVASAMGVVDSKGFHRRSPEQLLSVERLPSGPSLEVEGNVTALQPGQNLTLRCRAQLGWPPLKGRWHWDSSRQDDLQLSWRSLVPRFQILSQEEVDFETCSVLAWSEVTFVPEASGYDVIHRCYFGDPIFNATYVINLEAGSISTSAIIGIAIAVVVVVVAFLIAALVVYTRMRKKKIMAAKGKAQQRVRRNENGRGKTPQPRK